MNKVLPIIKKILKAILWVVVIFVLIFLLIAAIIQIPFVQTKIVNYATTFVSNKTHTRVEIESVSISFPKTVVLEGVFLEDQKKDTMIYVGAANINVAIKDLFVSRINVNNVSLENVKLNLYSTKTDSLFNYNFLITAFADSTKKDTTKTPSKWTFSIDNVSLKNIQLRYDDEYGGMDVTAFLKNLELSVDKLDLKNAVYGIDNLLVDGIKAKVMMKASQKVKTQSSGSVLPLISAHKIQINNSTITYEDSVQHQSVFAGIQEFELNDGSVDLRKQLVTLDKIRLAKSDVKYSSVNSSSKTKPKNAEPSVVVANDWQVSAKAVELADNSFGYDVTNMPVLKNSFDPNHIYFKYFNLEAKDIRYTSANTKAILLKFNAIDKNGFIITKFSTDFSMDHYSITAKKLKVKTSNSSIDGEVNLRFASLQSLSESLPNLVLHVNLKNASFKNADILYFNPQLIKQDFFKNKTNVTTLSGQINGPIKNLKGTKIVVRTGKKTVLQSDFSIVGLPNAKTASYNFPNMRVVSGKQDLNMIAGSSIPKNISLPDDISLLANFKGKMTAFATTLDVKSSFGAANMVATIDQKENFNGNITIENFNVGSLLNDKNMYGPVSLTAQVNGTGLKPETMKADVKANATEIYFNRYLYHDLRVDGNVSGREFSGKVNLNDKNAVLDFDGLVNITPEKEQYKFHLNLKGADLQKLNFTEKDLRIGLAATADLRGGTVNKLNGKAGISSLVLIQNGKKYALDSVFVASINETNKSEFNFESALIGLKYNGSISPASLPAAMSQFLNNYFPFADASAIKKDISPSNFTFEIQLRNHPILSEVLLPQLKEFEPGMITGSFDSRKSELKLNANMNRIVYGSTEIDGLTVDVISDSTALNYKVSSSSIGNSQINFANFLFDGKIANNKIMANLSSIDDKKIKRLVIQSQITKDKANYRLALDPANFYIMDQHWAIAPDNYIAFGKQGFMIHHLFMNNGQSQLNIASVHDTYNDDLNIGIKNFKLEDLSRIVEKDSSLVKGNVDGNVLLKRVNNSYGIIANADISNLMVRNVPIGNLAVKGDNPTTQRFDITAKLSGTDNNLTANGYFIPNGGDNSLNIKADIQSLSMKTVEAFSMGQITQAAGTVSGNFLVSGNTTLPDVTGELTFNNAFMNPTYFNNRYELKHETIQLKKDGLYFNGFTLLDVNQHKAVIDGKIQMKNFTDYIFDMKINSRNFLLFNTTVNDNKEFYGRMVIDSRIDIKGPMSLPVINAKLKMKKGSNFTFAVPEDKVTTDKGEDVVEFNEVQNANSILYKTDKKVIKKSSFTGFDLSSVVEVDKEATLRLLMDPASSDSLVVRGDAALSFTMDKSGKMSLTGAYHLNEGSYLISIESVIKRKFVIIPGSTIIWNGDPLDADISLNASYTVRAAPFDLVADQMKTLSVVEQGGYKQLYPFIVLLKLRGPILKPEITFEIQLAPEDKGILGGAVNQKLTMLNDDPSLLNKQVFALLVLGRFVQENPLQTESGGTSTLLRSTISNFLSAQLNQLSSKIVPGMSLNFDVQSYNDFQTGQAQGRTQVEIGLKQQLFNQRLTVQLGGTIDVEGEKAKQNSASEITSDVTVEYKLTKDGRYRLKGFRHNLYDGAIEGQIVETGVGVLYVRDFDKWKEFLKAPKKRVRANATKATKKVKSSDSTKSKTSTESELR